MAFCQPLKSVMALDRRGSRCSGAKGVPSFHGSSRVACRTYDCSSCTAWYRSNEIQNDPLCRYSKRRRDRYDLYTFKSGRVTEPIRIVNALQGSGRSSRRLVDVLRAIPRLSKIYFKSPFRRALYGGIALLGGFYVAQTISLSFGALGINDVIAAAICVLLAEYVTRFYYTRVKVSFSIALLNNFKMGFTYGLIIDAFKLAS